MFLQYIVMSCDYTTVLCRVKCELSTGQTEEILKHRFTDVSV